MSTPAQTQTTGEVPVVDVKTLNKPRTAIYHRCWYCSDLLSEPIQAKTKEGHPISIRICKTPTCAKPHHA